MSKKKIFIILPLVIFIVICVAVLSVTILNKKTSEAGDNKSKSGSQLTSRNFLIDEYPLATIPLYEIVKVESSKFYYNSDPADTSAFDESPFSYFNVVYETKAKKSDVFNYYLGLFDKEIKEEFSSSDSIKGVIDQYKIEVSQYGDDTVYLQVYVDETKSDSLRKELFSYFPMVEIDLSYVKLNEKSYGLLNQKDGEIEYTHYYTVSNTGDLDNNQIDDKDEFAEIQAAIQEKYKHNTGFSFKDGVFEWTSDNNESYIVSLSTDHGRVYVQIRKPI